MDVRGDPADRKMTFLTNGNEIRYRKASRQTLLLAAIVLAALTLFAYQDVTENGFINYDDPAYITKNSHVQKGLTLQGVAWAFTTPAAANWHPFTWLSLMADQELFGLNPKGFHWTSVILHLAAGLLLLAALQRMTGRVWPSAMVAGLFLLHPLHVESVAWAAERKDVLCGLFWMLGLWAYARYAERPGGVRYGAVILSFIAALLAKPMAVTFPFVLLLLDYWPLGRVDWDFAPSFASRMQTETLTGVTVDGPFPPRGVRRLLWEKFPLFFLSATASIITFLVQKEWGAVDSLENLTLADRAVNAVVAYAGYLIKMVFPLQLSVFYPRPAAWSVSDVLLSLGLLTGISMLVLLQMRRRHYLLVGWLWYLGTLVPVIGLVQVGSQTMADRYTYLPLIGIFVMLAWGVADLIREKALKRMVGGILAGAFLLACVLLTQFQVGYWKDSLTLFTQALKVTDNNYQALNNLGMAYAAQGNYGEAVDHYRESIRINPHYAAAYNNLGVAQMEQGTYAAALSSYQSALKIDPENGNVRLNRGLLFSRMGKIAEAIEEYRLALEKKPDDATLHNNFGVALMKQGLYIEAGKAIRRAIRIDPEHAGAHGNLGLLLMGEGQIDAAIDQFREAIRLQPEYVNAHYQLGIALVKKGRMEEAETHFRIASRLNPVIENMHR
jgi:tetratricopeptide (TPR) repeat protein